MIISERIKDVLLEYDVEKNIMEVTDRDHFSNTFDAEDIEKLKDLLYSVNMYQTRELINKSVNNKK